VFDGPEVATFSKFARVIGAHLTLAAIAIHQKQEIVSSLRDFSELQVWRGIFEMRSLGPNFNLPRGRACYRLCIRWFRSASVAPLFGDTGRGGCASSSRSRSR